MARKQDQVGVKVGERIARLMSRTRLQETQATSDLRVSEQVKARMAYWERSEQELAGVLTDTFAQAAANPDLPQEMRTAARILTGRSAQVGGQVLSIMLGVGVGGAAAAAFAPIIEPLRQEIWRANAHALIGAQGAAAAVAQGIWDEPRGVSEGAGEGVSRERFAALLQLAYRWPGLGETIELLNRGAVTEQQATEWLRRGGLDEDATRAVLELRQVLPSVQDVIRFAVREVFSPDVAERFGQFDDFPEGAVELAAKLGLDRETLGWYWAAHWNLPSPNQGFEMLHRGVIDQDVLRVLLRALDVMPYWRDKLEAIAYSVPTRVDIRRMYAEGIVDRDKVLRTYLDLGYLPDDAESLTQLAIAQRTSEDRALAKSEILQLYELQALDRTETAGALGDLGYADDEVEFILLIAESRRLRRLQSLATTRVRSRYVGRRVTEDEATTALDRIGVPADERDLLLQTWEAERDIDRPILTAATVGALFRDGLIPEDQARARWASQGYRSADIDLLVLRYGGGGPELNEPQDPTRQLTKSDIGRALREGTITVAQAIQQWMALGYSRADAEVLAANYLPEGEV